MNPTHVRSLIAILRFAFAALVWAVSLGALMTACRGNVTSVTLSSTLTPTSEFVPLPQ